MPVQWSALLHAAGDGATTADVAVLRMHWELLESGYEAAGADHIPLADQATLPGGWRGARGQGDAEKTWTLYYRHARSSLKFTLKAVVMGTKIVALLDDGTEDGAVRQIMLPVGELEMRRGGTDEDAATGEDGGSGGKRAKTDADADAGGAAAATAAPTSSEKPTAAPELPPHMKGDIRKRIHAAFAAPAVLRGDDNAPAPGPRVPSGDVPRPMPAPPAHPSASSSGTKPAFPDPLRDYGRGDLLPAGLGDPFRPPSGNLMGPEAFRGTRDPHAPLGGLDPSTGNVFGPDGNRVIPPPPGARFDPPFPLAGDPNPDLMPYHIRDPDAAPQPFHGLGGKGGGKKGGKGPPDDDPFGMGGGFGGMGGGGFGMGGRGGFGGGMGMGGGGMFM